MKELSTFIREREPSFAVRPVQSEEDLRLANGFMARPEAIDRDAARKWLEAHGDAYPGYRREHTRFAKAGGKVVGALRINSETLRLGEARLRVGVLGWVAVEPGPHDSAILEALAQDALRYLRGHGYQLAALFNVPGCDGSLWRRRETVCGRLGFVKTLEDFAIHVDAVVASEASIEPLKLRPAKPGDIARIAKLHNDGATERSCSLIRTRGHLRNKWQDWKDSLWVLADDDAKVVAYFAAREDSLGLTVEEVGVIDRALCQSVMAACAHMAADRMLTRLQCRVAPDHIFAQFLRRHEATQEMEVFEEGGGMMALVDAAETLEHLLPEWEALLARSPAGALRTEFSLLLANHGHTDPGRTFRIRANRGAVGIDAAHGPNKVSLSLDELLKLLTGYSELNEVLDSHRRLLTKESRMLLEAIFPKRSPYIWHFDQC